MEVGISFSKLGPLRGSGWHMTKKEVVRKGWCAKNHARGLGSGGHPTPSPGNQGSGWHQWRLLECQHWPYRARWGLSLQSVCALGWGRAGHPLSTPSWLSPSCLLQRL